MNYKIKSQRYTINRICRVNGILVLVIDKSLILADFAPCVSVSYHERSKRCERDVYN